MATHNSEATLASHSDEVIVTTTPSKITLAESDIELYPEFLDAAHSTSPPLIQAWTKHLVRLPDGYRSAMMTFWPLQKTPVCEVMFSERLLPDGMKSSSVVMFNAPFSKLSTSAQAYAIATGFGAAGHFRKHYGISGENLSYGVVYSSPIIGGGLFSWAARSMLARRPVPMGNLSSYILGAWCGSYLLSAKRLYDSSQIGHETAMSDGFHDGAIEYHLSKMWKLDRVALAYPQTVGRLTRYLYAVGGYVDPATRIREIHFKTKC